MESRGCLDCRIEPFPFPGRAVEVYCGRTIWASNFKADSSLEFGLIYHVLVDGGKAWLLEVWGWCDRNSIVTVVLVLWLWAWTGGCTDSLVLGLVFGPGSVP
ncbi:hypothetical protein M0R45_028612 [Rubus argutus]|uniref:Uncharacterized protein n=1 Tax=Rubus argutus TaxID=59490 RepID=A0AAW1W5U2_RUBAR